MKVSVPTFFILILFVTVACGISQDQHNSVQSQLNKLREEQSVIQQQFSDATGGLEVAQSQQLILESEIVALKEEALDNDGNVKEKDNQLALNTSELDATKI